MNYEPHPLAELIPPMGDEAYAALVEDIRANGLHEPITLFEGKILDGRHRARACADLGIALATTTYEGDAPAAYVVSLNVMRRQLTSGQRALIAIELLPHLEAEARARMLAGAEAGGLTAGRGRPIAPAPNGATPIGTSAGRRSSEEAGELAGVSARQVQRAKRVQEERPDLAEAVRGGGLALSTAETIIQGSTPDLEAQYEITTERQRQLAAKARERLGIALASLSGIAEGLDDFKIPTALAGSNDEEIQEWVRTLGATIRSLTRVQKRLGGR